MQNSTSTLFTFTHEEFSRYILTRFSHVKAQNLHEAKRAQREGQQRAPEAGAMDLPWAGVHARPCTELGWLSCSDSVSSKAFFETEIEYKYLFGK